MSNLVDYAKSELNLIYSEEDLKDGYNKMAYDCILELIETFAKQGHSGFSASYVRSCFNKLAAYETLKPLTGKDSEWIQIREEDGMPHYQNNRNGAVFKDGDGSTYFIDAVVWKDPEGHCYTNGKSRMPVKFPCTPKTFYVERYEDGTYNEEQYQKAKDYYEQN